MITVEWVGVRQTAIRCKLPSNWRLNQTVRRSAYAGRSTLTRRVPWAGRATCPARSGHPGSPPGRRVGGRSARRRFGGRPSLGPPAGWSRSGGRRSRRRPRPGGGAGHVGPAGERVSHQTGRPAAPNRTRKGADPPAITRRSLPTVTISLAVGHPTWRSRPPRPTACITISIVHAHDLHGVLHRAGPPLTPARSTASPAARVAGGVRCAMPSSPPTHRPAGRPSRLPDRRPATSDLRSLHL